MRLLVTGAVAAPWFVRSGEPGTAAGEPAGAGPVAGTAGAAGGDKNVVEGKANKAVDSTSSRRKEAHEDYSSNCLAVLPSLFFKRANPAVVTNAYDAKRYNDDWKSYVRSCGSPWGELEGHCVILSLPKTCLEEIENPGGFCASVLIAVAIAIVFYVYLFAYIF